MGRNRGIIDKEWFVGRGGFLIVNPVDGLIGEFLIKQVAFWPVGVINRVGALV